MCSSYHSENDKISQKKYFRKLVLFLSECFMIFVDNCQRVGQNETAEKDKNEESGISSG
jgi:hypothetical protein